MSDIELDFLRKCLVVDGAERGTVSDLLEHPYFTPEFKS
jgi:serine/threonine protein kinase